MARCGVVIVDDQPLYRGGVRAALEAESELHVIGETAGEAGMIDRIVAVQPDVVIIGVHDRAEIWSAERWNAEEEEMTPEKMAALMDSLEL